HEEIHELRRPQLTHALLNQLVGLVSRLVDQLEALLFLVHGEALIQPPPATCCLNRAIASATRSIAMISSPSILWLGRFALGMLGCVSPSLAASRRRSWPRGAGRTSPARPPSPKATSLRGSGLSASDETIASRIARSAAGSEILTPPTALTNTSWSKQAMPAWRCSTASSIASRVCSRPTLTRRGVGACAPSTHARVPAGSGSGPPRGPR